MIAGSSDADSAIHTIKINTKGRPLDSFPTSRTTVNQRRRRTLTSHEPPSLFLPSLGATVLACTRDLSGHWPTISLLSLVFWAHRKRIFPEVSKAFQRHQKLFSTSNIQTFLGHKDFRYLLVSPLSSTSAESRPKASSHSTFCRKTRRALFGRASKDGFGLRSRAFSPFLHSFHLAFSQHLFQSSSDQSRLCYVRSHLKMSGKWSCWHLVEPLKHDVHIAHRYDKIWEKLIYIYIYRERERYRYIYIYLDNMLFYRSIQFLSSTFRMSWQEYPLCIYDICMSQVAGSFQGCTNIPGGAEPKRV